MVDFVDSGARLEERKKKEGKKCRLGEGEILDAEKKAERLTRKREEKKGNDFS